MKNLWTNSQLSGQCVGLRLLIEPQPLHQPVHKSMEMMPQRNKLSHQPLQRVTESNMDNVMSQNGGNSSSDHSRYQDGNRIVERRTPQPSGGKAGGATLSDAERMPAERHRLSNRHFPEQSPVPPAVQDAERPYR